MNALTLGALLNSALFLTGVLASGLYAQNHVAALFALMSLGFCTLCYASQLAGVRYRAVAVVSGSFSWLLGIAALVALAAGYMR